VSIPSELRMPRIFFLKFSPFWVNWKKINNSFKNLKAISEVDLYSKIKESISINNL